MEPTLSTILGAAVRAARQRQELTQADVAERVGLATEVYGRLERGHMLPSVRTLLRICTVLHVSADRSEVYGVSLPRDAIIDRPDCMDADGTMVEGASQVMFNTAYSEGGAQCAVQTVELRKISPGGGV